MVDHAAATYSTSCEKASCFILRMDIIAILVYSTLPTLASLLHEASTCVKI